MSNVTSSSYPVITVSKAGDQFLVVQNGQLKKLTRGGLEALINSLVKPTILSLSDSPDTYVGQQGKVLVVDPTESKMVFEAATSGNFLALSDTPGAYGGQAGKLPVVNSGETALEFVDNALIKLNDTPANYTGAGGKVLKVKAAEDGIEFATPVNVEGNFSGGFFDYEHDGSSQAYTGGSGYIELENDGEGANTQKSYGPPSITDLWDASTNKLDFSELDLADMVGIRLDIDITTTANIQEFELALSLAEGSGIDYVIPLTIRQVKDPATRRIGVMSEIYIGNAETRDSPGSIVFQSPDNATIDVRGWYIRAIQRGIE